MNHFGPFHSRRIPEPLEYCGACGRGIWTANDLIRTATGTIIGNRCGCVDELLDGDCAVCRAPVLCEEYPEHLQEEHGYTEEAAEEAAKAEESAHA